VHSGDKFSGSGIGNDEVITIYLDKLAPNVTIAWVVVTIFESNFSFGNVRGVYCKLFDPNSKKEFCRFALSPKKDIPGTGNIVCSISRCQ